MGSSLSLLSSEDPGRLSRCATFATPAGRLHGGISARHRETHFHNKHNNNNHRFLPVRSSALSRDNDDGGETTPDSAEHNGTTKKKDAPRQEWTSQTMALALPALIGMLADPLLSMMDTAYVGNLGSSIELAALGACTSIFHLAFNAFRATTAATTSLVGTAQTPYEKREIVRVSLSLGILLGLGVGGFLRILGPWCLSTMGVAIGSPLFAPAISYLRTRSLAAPAVLAITVCEGAFRGYGDTRIPLLASLVASVVNLVLDPLLMLPPLSRGVQGAAAATATSQIGALAVYFWFLGKRRMLPQKTSKAAATANGEQRTTTAASSSASDTATAPSKRKIVATILGANLAMVCKQGSLLLAWAYATAKATRIGSAHVAAHQVGLSCWLVFALIQDGAGVAAQVLLTRVLNKDTTAATANDTGDDDNATATTTESIDATNNVYDQAKSLVWYMTKFAVAQGCVTTGALLLASPYLPGWFVPDDPVVRGHLRSLLPHVAGQQLLVSLTLVAESLSIGGGRFRLLAVGTATSTVLAVARLKTASTVAEIWSRGIVGLFVGRLVTAAIGTASVLREQRRKQLQQQQQ